ncbi:MAG: hypothetical protein ACRDXB_19745, partial [Actinomycetes bacterium]
MFHVLHCKHLTEETATLERLTMSDNKDDQQIPGDENPQGVDQKAGGGCPVVHDGVTDTGSESENPAIPSPEPKVARPRTNKDWWPDQLPIEILHQGGVSPDPMGADFDYAAAFG